MQKDALCWRSSQSKLQVVRKFNTTFTNTSFIHKIIDTYKCLCDLTMVCELPLRRKDDWPQETMARSCLYISFSSSRTDCAKTSEPGKVNINDNSVSRNSLFLLWYPPPVQCCDACSCGGGRMRRRVSDSALLSWETSSRTCWCRSCLQCHY